MNYFSPEMLVKITNGKIITWHEDRGIQLIIEQTELPCPDCLYFVFDSSINEGELLSSLSRYQAAAVVAEAPCRLDASRWAENKIGIIEVTDIRAAYIALSEAYRAQFDFPTVEIIGTFGKTITKEMIGSVLKKKLNAFIGYGSFNAPLGVAYNVFHLRPGHQAAVLEAGTNAPGFVQVSSNIIKPRIGIVTSIVKAYYDGHATTEDIIGINSLISRFLPKGGLLLINWEDENCRLLNLEGFQGTVLTYGFSDQCDVWASDIHYDNMKMLFKAKGKDFEIDCAIKAVGRCNVLNALAAVITGLKLGLTPQEISEGLWDYKPEYRRQQVIKGIKNTILINDSFHANYYSTKLLLNDLPAFVKNKPLLLVLGDIEGSEDMDESDTCKLHFDIGQQAGALNFYKLIAVGRWAEEYVKGALSAGAEEERLVHMLSVRDAKKAVLNALICGSMVVLNASYCIDFEALVDLLMYK